jgi:signal transduction histidine kinase/ActR/RegA family two-component response regulator
MKLTATQKSYLVVFATGALIVLIISTSFFNSANKKRTSELVQHTEQVISNSNSLLMDLVNHESGIRGYLITEKKTFLQPYYSSLSTIKKHFKELNKLTSDNLQQQKRIDTLEILINKRIDLSGKLINLVKEHKINNAGKIAGVEQGKMIADKIRVLFVEINKTEYKLLTERKSENDSKDITYNLLFLFLAILSFVILIIYYFSILKNQIKSKLAQEEKHTLELNAIKLTADKVIAEESSRLSQLAVDAKQQFLSTMSHEIRTPLNSILGFTNVLLKTHLGEKQKEFVQAIKTSGDSLIFLINDILDLAKVNAGKMTFEKKPFQIKKSIKLLQNSFDLIVKEKNLEIVNEYDNKIPEMLVGDSVRLNQIFLNLMSNAVKFTHKGKITISIKLLSEDEENTTIEFAITDTGIGIAENKINSIFNVFEHAEIGSSNSYGGSGLGLAIVKQLVESQGGSIGLKSKVGEGSTFSFILTFEKTTMKVETETEIIKQDSQIKNMRVLVAEDVALNQLLIKMILSDFGFEHEVVANGKIAIEKLQTNTYDIILMDLNMPEMNGFEATEYIRNTMKSNIPIIALTADVTVADVNKCKESGMNDYISKPIDEELLYRKMVELIKKQ